MTTTVEYILEISGGKSKENIKRLIGELKKTQSELGGTGKKSEKAMKKTERSTKKATKALNLMKGSILSIAGAVGGVVAGFVGLNKVLADSVNEIVDANTKTGIATDTLAGLRLAAEGSGKSFQDLERGLINFQKKMVDASKGSGEMTELFSHFGGVVDKTTGKMKSSDKMFKDVISTLSKMENGVQKNNAVLRLFGKSGEALLQSGAIGGLDEFIARAKELGPALDENGIQKAADFQRGWADFKTASMGAIQSLLEGLTGEKGLGPSLSSLAEDMSNFAGGTKIFLESMRDAFNGFLIFLKDVKKSLKEIKSLMAIVDAFVEVGTQKKPAWAKNLSDAEYDRMVKMGMGGAEPPKPKDIFERGFIKQNTTPENMKRIAGFISRYTTSQNQAMKEFLRLALPDETNKDLIKFNEELKKLKDSGASQKEIFEFYKKRPSVPLEDLTQAQQKDLKLLAKFLLQQEMKGNINFKELSKSISNIQKQGQETRKAIKKRTKEQLTKLINSGDIKDFQNVENQLINLKNSLTKSGESTDEIDKLIKRLQKLKKESEKPIDINFNSGLGKGKGKGKGKTDSDTPDSLKELNKLFENGEKALSKYRKEAQKLQLDTMENLNESFMNLVSSVKSGNFEISSATHEAKLLKNEYEQIGQDTTNLDQLIKKLESLNKIETGIKITTDVIGLASGDVVGGISGILSKSLSGASLAMIEPITATLSALTSFGGDLNNAAQQKIEEVQQQREDTEIQKLEDAFGRSLTDAEKERIKNDVKLSEQEKRDISESAMMEKAEQDVQAFTVALTTGIKMLPTILLEVLPPLFIDLAYQIVSAIIQIPFRIVKGIIEGVQNIFKSFFVDAPKKFAEDVGGFFTSLFNVDSKFSGGRIPTGFSGMRFRSKDGLALLHKNEYVVPQSGAKPQAVERIMNQQSNAGITINVTADIVERDGIEELVRRIEQKFQNFGTMRSSLFAG